MNDKHLTTEALVDEGLKRLALADETCRINAKLLQLMRQFMKLQRQELARLIEDGRETLH